MTLSNSMAVFGNTVGGSKEYDEPAGKFIVGGDGRVDTTHSPNGYTIRLAATILDSHHIKIIETTNGGYELVFYRRRFT